jgi:thiamine pyrophosphokinase
MKRALIVGGGPVDLGQMAMLLAESPDLTVAADSGGSYFLALQALPDVLLGDFDSLAPDEFNLLKESGVAFRQFPQAKDQTDLELALDYALTQGIEWIDILGGLGGRFDHSLGNIGLLVKAWEQGAQAHLLDERHDLSLIGPARPLTLPAREGWAVSLIPLTPQVSGITSTGLAYPLHDDTLCLNHSRGIHNRFSEIRATVTIKTGWLLVVVFCEAW